MKPVFFSILILITITTASSRGQEEPPAIMELRKTLQQNVMSLPEIIPALQKEDLTFHELDLKETRTEIDGHSYYAFRFTTPEDSGRELVWSFRAMDGLEQWFIFPESGTIQGFRRFQKRPLLFKSVENAGKKGDLMIMQRLAAEQLQPTSTYIIWFRFQDTAEPKVNLSLNLLKEQPNRELAHVFPMLY